MADECKCETGILTTKILLQGVASILSTLRSYIYTVWIKFLFFFLTIQICCLGNFPEGLLVVEDKE